MGYAPIYATTTCPVPYNFNQPQGTTVTCAFNVSNCLAQGSYSFEVQIYVRGAIRIHHITAYAADRGPAPLTQSSPIIGLGRQRYTQSTWLTT